MLFRQGEQRRIIQTGEAGENENVAYLLQPGAGGLKVENPRQLLFRQKAPARLDLFDGIDGKGIAGDQTRFEREGRNAFEDTHQFLRGVDREAAIDLEVGMEVHDEGMVDRPEGNIPPFAVDEQKLFQPVTRQEILVERGLGNVYADQFATLFDEIREDAKQRIFPDLFTQVFVPHHIRSDQVVELVEFLVVVQKRFLQVIQIQVGLRGLLRASRSTVALGIPDRGPYRDLGAELAGLAVDGQTHMHGRVALGIDFVFSDEEKNLESAFHTVEF